MGLDVRIRHVMMMIFSPELSHSLLLVVPAGPTWGRRRVFFGVLCLMGHGSKPRRMMSQGDTQDQATDSTTKATTKAVT